MPKYLGEASLQLRVMSSGEKDKAIILYKQLARKITASQYSPAVQSILHQAQLLFSGKDFLAAGLCVQDYYVLYDKIVEMEKDGPIVVGSQGITMNQFEIMLSGFRVEVNQVINQFYSVLFQVLTEIKAGH